MEIDKSETEKILEYLDNNLHGFPMIDAIVAGVLIANDFSKMEKVVELIKKSRELMSARRLKKEDEIMLYDEMLQKLDEAHRSYQYNSNQSNNVSVQSADSSEKDRTPVRKREQKAQIILQEKLTHEIAEPIDIDEESCILITETENKENSNEISKNKIDAK